MKRHRVVGRSHMAKRHGVAHGTMKCLLSLVVGFALLLLLCAAPAQATIIYASSGNQNAFGGGRIWTIDTATNTSTLIGNTGLSRTSGLAFDNNGNLYLTDGGSSGPSRLYSVNPSTAAVTLIGTIGIQGIGGIAFDSAGTLWAGGWNGHGQLLTIDPATGAILTDVSMTGTGNAFVPGLDFNSNGTLYGSRGGSNGHTEDLVTINTATGVETPIGGVTINISDIAFGSDGILYGGSVNGDLFSIDPLTGQKTFLFNTGFNISGLTSLRTVVPEPTTLSLLGLGLLGLGVMGWRRRSVPLVAQA